jgi:SAM-dependent methyltransferase
MADRRLPVSREFGFDRGLPVDRHYISHFVGRFACRAGYAAGDIRGHVLEIGGREYVDRFGVSGEQPAPGVVHRVDVMHESEINPGSTIVGDLVSPGTLPPATFDCIICTQVLPVIWDIRAALSNLHESLRPGGVLLLTVPGITRSLVPDRDHWGDFWRFTSGSARRLVQEVFPCEGVEVEAYGNLQAATFFLHGHAAHELSLAELDLRDPAYEVIIGVRARKQE